MFGRKKTYEDRSDEVLMSLIAKGDERAGEALYRRHAGRMVRFFARMLGGDESRAQDFTQELFLRVFRNAERFNPEHAFSTWLYTIAHNLCKNEYRRRNRHPVTEPVAPHHQPGASEPWRQMDRSAFEAHLERCLAELDEEQRRCFVLRFQEELSVRQISEILGCPEGTVKSRLHYTVKKLAGRLQAFNPKP